MDVEQRARELLAAEWKKQRDFGAPYSFATYMVELIEKGEWDSAPDMCALVAALTPPECHVVVTRNEAGQAVAVTRQDDEGRILSVIAEFELPERSDQSLLELAAIFDTCIPFLPSAGQRNIGKAVAQLRHMAMGYVLVPVEMTERMLDVLWRAVGDMRDADMQDLWSELLAARPEVKA